MSIPTYEELLRPILEMATHTDTTRRNATTAMAEAFQLTDEERQALLPSGSATTINNRAGWAMTFLTKAGLIKKVAKFTYRATDAGISFLAQHPDQIREADLKKIEGYQQAWDKAKERRKQKDKDVDSDRNGVLLDSKTPEELIGKATVTLEESLRAELLGQLHEIDPFRFEQIVLDLLSAMGYGGSREEAAKVTKRSNDEGIDGVINEDRLGLDVIYVQAKRYKNNVGRVDIQNFVGALAGKQANKGVFITTSGFASTAREYASAVSQKVILIDGARLADLMIEHNIGVSTIRTIAIKRLDTDYFED